MPRRRGSYFAHFAEEGKELETQFERSPRSDGFPAVSFRGPAQAVIPSCSLRQYLAPVESAVVSRPNLDITGGTLGSAIGSANKSYPKAGLRKSAGHALVESNLSCYGQIPLTTRRFTRKVNTPFYHARPATCPVRPYKRLAGHSSIPDPAAARDPVRSLRHMTTQLLNEAAQVIPNQQLLINVVSKRVRQLGLGHRPLVETTPRMSLTDIALKEIIAGKLAYEALEESSDGA